MSSGTSPAVGTSWIQQAAETIQRNRQQRVRSFDSYRTTPSLGMPMPSSGWDALVRRAHRPRRQRRSHSATQSALQEVPSRYFNACAVNRYHRTAGRRYGSVEAPELPGPRRPVSQDELEMCPVWCDRAISRVRDKTLDRKSEECMPQSLSDAQAFAVREFQSQAEARGMSGASLHSEQHQSSAKAKSWICGGCKGWQWTHQVCTKGLCASCVVDQCRKESRELRKLMKQ